MFDLLLKNARLQDGSRVDVAINGNRFAKIAAKLDLPASETFDCNGMYLLPPFYNCHTHSPMTLFRGYADDLELFPWLNEHIWPAEAKLNEDDVYCGSRLAILEMIKSGTVFFNDSYFWLKGTIRAAEEMGIRTCIGLFWINVGNKEQCEWRQAENAEIFESWKSGAYSDRIQVSRDPHAIYSVPEGELRKLAEMSEIENLTMHIHMSETETEFNDCRKAHNGMTPFEYADSLGLINQRARLAHCVWMTDNDRKIAAEKGAVLISNPTSNMKLCSGMFHFKDAEAAGCRIALGTDGCASNNAHSFFSEMKIAALVGKIQSGDPTACPATRVFEYATQAAKYFVPEACEIAEDKLADAMLINPDQPYFVGDYNLISNLVYAGESSCVDSLLCDGKFLMKHRVVPGEEEILADARKACNKYR